jgi:uncharacterized protein YgiB involved in biofilm formation
MRKSSGRVTLVLIGVAALTGCGESVQRDVYKSQADCLADWGNTPQDCTPATETRHQGMGYFYGPSYSSPHSSWWLWNRGSSWSSSTRGSRAIGSFSSHGSSHSSSHTTRGGFGSSAHSSGG